MVQCEVKRDEFGNLARGELFAALSAECEDLTALWQRVKQPSDKSTDADRIAGTHALWCPLCRATRAAMN